MTSLRDPPLLPSSTHEKNLGLLKTSHQPCIPHNQPTSSNPQHVRTATSPTPLTVKKASPTPDPESVHSLEFHLQADAPRRAVPRTKQRQPANDRVRNLVQNQTTRRPRSCGESSSPRGSRRATIQKIYTQQDIRDMTMHFASLPRNVRF